MGGRRPLGASEAGEGGAVPSLSGRPAPLSLITGAFHALPPSPPPGLGGWTTTGAETRDTHQVFPVETLLSFKLRKLQVLSRQRMEGTYGVPPPILFTSLPLEGGGGASLAQLWKEANCSAR